LQINKPSFLEDVEKLLKELQFSHPSFKFIQLMRAIIDLVYKDTKKIFDNLLTTKIPVKVALQQAQKKYIKPLEIVVNSLFQLLYTVCFTR